MTYAISSAEPSKLTRYSDVTTNLDAVLASAASPLNSALRQFEATCREPGFRLQVSHVSDWLVTYANKANRVDFWVRQVGLGFLHADAGTILRCIAGWAWRAFQIAWNRFVDFVADTGRKLQDALSKIAVQIGRVYTAAANAVLAAANAYASNTALKTGLFFFTEFYKPLFRERALLLLLAVADSTASVWWAKLAPKPQATPGGEVKVPTTMAELYSAIRHEPGDKNAIRVMQIGPGEYLVLVDGTVWDPSGGGRYATTNITSGIGLDSVYTERLRKIIEERIPPGSKIHLAGYSLGGHTAQVVGNEFADSGKYVVGSVISFGAYFVARPNSAIGVSRAFLFEDDILNQIDKKGVDNAFRPFGGADEALYEETILHDSGAASPVEAHGNYGKSKEYDDDGRDTLPFAVTPGQTAPVYEYDAPQQAPITSSLLAGGAWAQATIDTTTDAIAQKWEETVQTVEDAHDYVTNTVSDVAETVADTVRFVQDVKQAADVVVDIVESTGVL
jgi:hypothetical protein